MRNTLFSDYYIAELMPQDDAVRRARDRVESFGAYARELLGDAGAAVETATEAELEDRLIRPLLRQLGFEYLVQTGLRPQHRVPDYMLFASSTQKRRAESNREAAPQFAIGLAEAKRWEASLDRGAGAAYDDRNPSLQVDEYLRRSELDWAILTNGRFWRLYNRASSYRLDSFLEFDLPAALTDPDELAAFLTFFSATSFPAVAGEGLLQRALASSVEHAARLGTDLQPAVYEALRSLCEGLIREAERAEVHATLAEVRDAAFALIFRLLFVLFAEARGYLPVDDETYRLSYSVRGIAHELADIEARIATLSPTTYGYWTRLASLFRLIYEGSEEQPSLAPYDGGLFDDGQFPLLTQLRVGDQFLAHAINRLTRTDIGIDRRRARGFVTYRDLGVRELGTIYEALLEQHPFVAEEETVVVKRGESLLYMPAHRARGRVVQRFPAGSILLRTDQGERRETGTYYTPEPVVRYMTDAALHRVLESRRGQMSDVDAVLGVRVVDPAMGSGHFLVEAVDVLARELVAALTGGAPTGEEDVRWARREVVERCIYGVDLNPLAVELAKLSLWLTTIQVGKPLSFLDHHLRVGNSVLFYPLAVAVEGGRGVAGRPVSRRQRGQDDDQATVWEGDELGATTARRLVQAMEDIGRRPSDSISDVETKRQEFEQAYADQEAVRQFLNLCVAAVFDRRLRRTVKFAYLILYQGGRWQTPAIGDALAAAATLAAERRFFHWEAEFPEVFLRQERGFDAVLSNPPYVSAWRMQKIDPSMRRIVPELPQYENVATRHWDLFVPFASLATDLLGPHGVLALILPNPANREMYAENLRINLLAAMDFEEVVDFGSTEVFENVDRQSVIWVAKKRRVPIPADEDTHVVRSIAPDSIASDPVAPVTSAEIPQLSWRVSPRSQISVNLTPEEAALVAAISGHGIPLTDVLQISYGAQVSGNADDAFGRERYLSHELAGMRNPVPFLEGRDLRPFIARWRGWYLDYRPDEFYGPRTPALFESPKVVVRHVSGDSHTLIALAEFEGRYLDHGSIVGVSRDPAVVGTPGLLAIAGVLNSSVANFYYQSVFATDSLLGEYSHVYPGAVKAARLPGIPSAEGLVAVGELHDGHAWREALADEAIRVSRWDHIVASLAARLHEIAGAIGDESANFVRYIEDRLQCHLPITLADRIADDEMSEADVLQAVKNARGTPLELDQFHDVEVAITSSVGAMEALRREATYLDGLVDEVVEDAFGLDRDVRLFMHTFLAARGRARGSRLWPKAWG